MPRQIPLKRARGGDADSIGCGTAYLQFIGIIIGAALFLGIIRVILDNFGFIVRAILIAAGIFLIGLAFQERDQIKPWLASVEEQIEQWTRDDKRFTIIVVTFSILICLIFAVLGIVVLLRW